MANEVSAAVCTAGITCSGFDETGFTMPSLSLLPRHFAHETTRSEADDKPERLPPMNTWSRIRYAPFVAQAVGNVRFAFCHQ